MNPSMNLKKLMIVALVIILSFSSSIWYLGVNGLFAAIPWSVLIIVLSNLERVTSLIASSYKLGRGIHFWFEKNAVEKRLESTIGLTSKKVNEEGVHLLPHGVDIKWVKPMQRDAFLKEGKIIVCLESSYNEARNLARATMLYVSEDLIRESQRFIDTTVMRSANFAIARKMLSIDKKLDALKCLNEEFIEPEAHRAPKIRDYVPAMEKMDEEGHLTRVLLHEFSQLDAKLSPALSDLRAMKETRSFTELLKVFEEREREEDVPLRHEGKTIKVNLIPVARLGTVFDPSRYVNRALECFEEGIGTLYVLARGLNVELAKLVIEEIEKAKLYIKREEWEFKIPKRRGGIKSYVGVLVKVTT